MTQDSQRQTPQDRYCKVGSLNTRYWQAGHAGKPIVLIHGIGGSIEGWLPCWDAFAAAHRVYALDLPGHGRTDKPLNISYRMADLVQFVKDVMSTTVGMCPCLSTLQHLTSWY